MRFVIIASPRTGSSHLINTLTGHPDIFCHGNVFAEKMLALFWPKNSRPSAEQAKEDKAALRQLRENDPEMFLERVFLTSHGKQHVGFKIFEGQNDGILNKVISMPTVRKVVLFRKNVLANYASAKAAAKSGIWGVKKDEAIPDISAIQFSAKDFSRFHAEYIGFYQSVLTRINNANEPFWLINYDEINDEQILKGLTQFIGADPRKAISEDQQRKQQVKLNSTDILSRFANGKKVQLFLEANGLLHWRTEGLTSLESLHHEN